VEVEIAEFSSDMSVADSHMLGFPFLAAGFGETALDLGVVATIGGGASSTCGS
jgi:hypothetical protein